MGKQGFFGILQKIGQSLMMPVSVLPAAGLLVACGRMLQNASQGPNGVVTEAWINGLGQVCFNGGIAIFEQLPVVFAIGVAIGFTGGAGVAGLAAVVGYFTMMDVMKVMHDLRHLPLDINTGVFGGIVIGILSAQLYQRFHTIKLHPVFGFFAGKRFVPIVTAGVAILTGLVFSYVWPPIQEGINTFGLNIMGSPLGPAFYAAVKRMLIPVGLHHVYYPPFLYQFGSYTLPSGQVLHGDSPRYFGGDPTAGLFMASEFPMMLFGLPAAAYAMFLRAEPAKRKAVGGIMLTAALTSIITGITEPIEFAFIFVAPILYVFHIGAAFLSGMMTRALDIHLGYTFSSSAIDFVLGYFNSKNSKYLFLVVGPVMALLYFSVFYYLIGKLNLKTPGRGGDDADATDAGPTSERAANILSALGGSTNISALDACITRLRLTVNDGALVNKARLKEIGAAGILDAGKGNFQVVFGVESDQIKEEMLSLMRQGAMAAPGSRHLVAATSGVAPIQARAAALTVLRSPLNGRIVPLTEVPDVTFAEKILGDGFAIEPTDGKLCSPVDGKVTQLFRTHHAVGILTSSGLEILLHIGLDTVKMKGQGFTARVAVGDPVRAGDVLIDFDLARVGSEAKSTITAVIVTNMDLVKGVKSLKSGQARVGDSVFEIQT